MTPLLSLLSDSNQRPADYKAAALANWAKEANFQVGENRTPDSFVPGEKCYQLHYYLINNLGQPWGFEPLPLHSQCLMLPMTPAGPYNIFVGIARLERATTASQMQHSNQLNYIPNCENLFTRFMNILSILYCSYPFYRLFIFTSLKQLHVSSAHYLISPASWWRDSNPQFLHSKCRVLTNSITPWNYVEQGRRIELPYRAWQARIITVILTLHNLYVWRDSNPQPLAS